MTWNEARAAASEIMEGLKKRFQSSDLRLVLRALNREHHKVSSRGKAKARSSAQCRAAAKRRWEIVWRNAARKEQR